MTDTGAILGPFLLLLAGSILIYLLLIQALVWIANIARCNTTTTETKS